MKAVQKLGYVPLSTARNLRSQKTHRIALLIPDISGPYWDLLAKHFINMADNTGYQVVILDIGTMNREIKAFHELLQGFADGALIAGSSYLGQSHFDQLAARGYACTVIDNSVDPNGFDVVRTHEHQAREDAVEHLIDRGKKNIALFSDEQNDNLREHARDYLSILHSRGLMIRDAQLSSKVFNRESAYNQAKAFLQSNDPPDAIITVADTAALGVHAAAKELGIDIPTQLAIIGAGNVPETVTVSPKLSTIGQRNLNFDLISKLVFSRLESKGKQEGKIINFPRVFIPRDSS
jgi:DNA-binding LacI/PurR family transcriptional regulator